MNKTKKLVLSGLLIAMGIIVPFLFHLFNGGKIFLPMHIPVLLAGFIVGPYLGLLIGIITPMLSSVLTGMPPLAPIPIALIMSFELGVYGLISGMFYSKLKQNVFVSLVVSMIAGRIVAGIVVTFLTYVFGMIKLNPLIYIWTGIVTGIPGIIIQLIIVPGVVYLLKRTKVLKQEGYIEA